MGDASEVVREVGVNDFAAKKAHSVAATAESIIQSVDFESGVELGSRRDRALRASRIEIKIDRITPKSGDISQKKLDFLFLPFLWTAFV
jgi:hypothetical protein